MESPRPFEPEPLRNPGCQRVGGKRVYSAKPRGAPSIIRRRNPDFSGLEELAEAAVFESSVPPHQRRARDAPRRVLPATFTFHGPPTSDGVVTLTQFGLRPRLDQIRAGLCQPDPLPQDLFCHWCLAPLPLSGERALGLFEVDTSVLSDSYRVAAESLGFIVASCLQFCREECHRGFLQNILQVHQCFIFHSQFLPVQVSHSNNNTILLSSHPQEGSSTSFQTQVCVVDLSYD